MSQSRTSRGPARARDGLLFWTLDCTRASPISFQLASPLFSHREWVSCAAPGRQPCGENGEEWASLAVLPLKLLKKLPKLTTWPCAVKSSKKKHLNLNVEDRPRVIRQFGRELFGVNSASLPKDLTTTSKTLVSVWRRDRSRGTQAVPRPDLVPLLSLAPLRVAAGFRTAQPRPACLVPPGESSLLDPGGCTARFSAEPRERSSFAVGRSHTPTQRNTPSQRAKLLSCTARAPSRSHRLESLARGRSTWRRRRPFPTAGA
jgi:hypothetical protein